MKEPIRKGANLSNIKKLTKLYNMRTEQNKQKFEELLPHLKKVGFNSK